MVKNPAEFINADDLFIAEGRIRTTGLIACNPESRFMFNLFACRLMSAPPSVVTALVVRSTTFPYRLISD
jgi:hypothetical protein